MTCGEGVATGTDELRSALSGRLTGEGKAWLDEAVAAIRSDATAIRTRFPAADRRCGRGDLIPTSHCPTPPRGWTVGDAARVLLLHALPLRGTELAEEVSALYRHGDSAEKRGVLHGLPLLDGMDGMDGETGIGKAGLPMVHDALRTNDTRLITAALGPYGAARLDAATYRQGILKCVFVGVPLADISGLDHRADAELARMLVDFAHERVAAGRDVPADVWPLVDRHPETLDASSLPAELQSGVPARREAARRALGASSSARSSRPHDRES